jgi:hypothetical protein
MILPDHPSRLLAIAVKEWRLQAFRVDDAMSR